MGDTFYVPEIARSLALAALTTASLGGAPAAQAGPDVSVPCSSAALASAISTAGVGETLSLAAGCVYRQATLPAVSGNLTITGNGATLRDSGNLTVTWTATLAITSLDFRRNRIVITGAGRADITGGAFTGDTGTNGGAIENDSSTPRSGLQVTGATFIGNTATFAGGAIYGGGHQGAIITDCAFSRNHAGAFGGAITDDTQSGAVITGSLIAGNTAVNEGGGGASLGGGPDIGGFGASPRTRSRAAQGEGSAATAVRISGSSSRVLRCRRANNADAITKLRNRIAAFNAVRLACPA
jgi:predicted outer membrane repeat protein